MPCVPALGTPTLSRYIDIAPPTWFPHRLHRLRSAGAASCCYGVPPAWVQSPTRRPCSSPLCRPTRRFAMCPTYVHLGRTAHCAHPLRSPTPRSGAYGPASAAPPTPPSPARFGVANSVPASLALDLRAHMRLRRVAATALASGVFTYVAPLPKPSLETATTRRLHRAPHRRRVCSPPPLRRPCSPSALARLLHG